MACVILVPQPGIELGLWVMRMWSSNHWTYKEFPFVALFALSVYVCGNVLSNYFALKWLEIVSVCVLMPQLNVQMYFFSFDMGDLFLNNFVLYLCEIFIWSSCLPSLLPYWRAQLRSDWTGPSEEGSQVWRCPNSDQGSYKTIGPGLPGQSSAYKSVLQCRGRRLDPWLDNWDCVCLGAPKPTHHNYWVCMLQSPSSTSRESMRCNKRSHDAAKIPRAATKTACSQMNE